MSVWYGPEFEGSIGDEETGDIITFPSPRAAEVRARSFEKMARRAAREVDGSGATPISVAALIRGFLNLARLVRGMK